MEVRIESQSWPAHETVRVLAALSDVNRYRIVEHLADAGELSCGALAGALGLSASLTSHHLSVLESAGVVQRRKDGFCTLNSLRRDELANRLACLSGMLERRNGGTAELRTARTAECVNCGRLEQRNA